MSLPRQSNSETGFPYALVDRVLDLEPGVRGTARKLVSANEPYFVGHFPNFPVMPGVLLCEALAQLGATVVGADPDPVEIQTITRARFRLPVVPGDVLDLDVRVLGDGPPWRVQGAVRRGAENVADVELLLAAFDGAYIHPTAVVSSDAELDARVHVGPYAVIGPRVRVGPQTRIGAHAVLGGRTVVGARNRIFPFASIGLIPQDLKYRGEPSRLEIGDDNAIREFVSVHPGTEGGGMLTRIGSGCLLMVNSHVAHDCILGDEVRVANGASLGGHVVIEDHAIVGGLAGVHQFARIGESALCAAGAMVSLDVPPYCLAAGDRARLFGLNLVGLRRRGFSDETVRYLKRAYRLLFLRDGSRREAIERTRGAIPDVAEVGRLVDFVEGSERGVCRP